MLGQDFSFKAGEENEKYWLGKQYEGPVDEKARPMVDNLIFESLETFLPRATKRNPEPLVTLDNSEKSDDGNDDQQFNTNKS